MRYGVCALTLGLLSLRWLPMLPTLAMLLGGFLLLLLLPWRCRPLLWFLAGLCWACWSAQQALDDRLDPDFDGRTLWLEGRVSGLPEPDGRGLRFQLEQPQARHGRLPQRLRLFWPDAPPMQAGERWRLAVKLKRPHGLVNPQGFDYEAWLLARRIGATGSVKAGQRLQAAEGPAAWRDGLRQRIAAVDAWGRSGALAALVVGDASGLSQADWRVLQDTGTVHLMVISGQHVGMLAALLYALVATLARLGWWPASVPWLPSACLLAGIGALCYGLLAGFEVPVQRACVMVALALSWRLRFRHLGLFWPLLLALCAVLLSEPLASLQPGFWLSFGAVAVLGWVFAGRLGRWRWWQVAWRAQWTVALGLLPLFFALGLPVSYSGPLANLLAVPWVSVLVVPLALLGTLLLPLPVLGEGLLWLAGGALQLLFVMLELLAHSLPAWLPQSLPLSAWLLGSLGLWLLLAPAGVPLRMLAPALLLVLIWPDEERPATGRAEVWQLDVGQGSAVLVRTRNHALLYDAGPSVPGFDLGERVVVPSLRYLGVQQLDMLLLSHADSDHSGGAQAVQHGLPVARVLAGEAARLPAGLAAEACRSGLQWDWDGVRLRTWQWSAVQQGNAASCVLLVEANGERLLLTGDIDQAAERAFLQSADAGRLDWLQVPHHGSRSSSGGAFLDALRPRAALLSRGRHNAYGHPHAEVLERYRARAIRVHDSSASGAVRLLLGAHGEAHHWRERAVFWREK